MLTRKSRPSPNPATPPAPAHRAERAPRRAATPAQTPDAATPLPTGAHAWLLQQADDLDTQARSHEALIEQQARQAAHWRLLATACRLLAATHPETPDDSPQPPGVEHAYDDPKLRPWQQEPPPGFDPVAAFTWRPGSEAAAAGWDDELPAGVWASPQADTQRIPRANGGAL